MIYFDKLKFMNGKSPNVGLEAIISAIEWKI